MFPVLIIGVILAGLGIAIGRRSRPSTRSRSSGVATVGPTGVTLQIQRLNPDQPVIPFVPVTPGQTEDRDDQQVVDQISSLCRNVITAMTGGQCDPASSDDHFVYIRCNISPARLGENTLQLVLDELNASFRPRNLIARWQ